MTIDEAIKTKEHPPKTRYTWDIERINEADNLSIEALKWVKRYRPRNKTDNWSLLPGETEPV